MAVGKGSMDRASKAAKAKGEKAEEIKKKGKAKSSKKIKTAVVEVTNEQVMEQIKMQEKKQFFCGLGDELPVHFL